MVTGAPDRPRTSGRAGGLIPERPSSASGCSVFISGEAPQMHQGQAFRRRRSGAPSASPHGRYQGLTDPTPRGMPAPVVPPQ